MAAEKIIKAAIRSGPEKPVENHRLLAQAARAAELGAPTISIDLLRQVDCDVGTRHGQTDVSQDEAVAAHQASRLIVAPFATWLQTVGGPPRGTVGGLAAP